MRAVIQRVLNGNVVIDGNKVGEIGVGLVVLLGIKENDNEDDKKYMIDKLTNLRIFEDSEGKMNLSLTDIGGKILLIPNFTLYGDTRKGRRPSFTGAGDPKVASSIFYEMIELIRETGISVEHGEFGADMKVSILNDGPVTFFIDSEKII